MNRGGLVRPGVLPLRIALAASLLCVASSDHAWAAPSETDAAGQASAPSSESLTALRARIGRGRIRMWCDRHLYEVASPTLDSAGVWFDARQIEARRPSRFDEEPKGPPLSSPVPWDRISRIEARRSHWLAGAVVGLVAGVVVDMAVISRATDATVGFFLPIPPLVLTPIGALTGLSYSGWQVVWSR